MRATRRSTALSCLVAIAAALGPLLVVPAAPARAAGETVVGELVQAWAEESPGAVEEQHGHAAPELLTWVEPPRGDAVRVPTDDLPDLPGLAAGATVEVTVGGEVVDTPAEEGMDPAAEILDLDLLAAAPPVSPATAGTTNEVTVVLVQPGGVPSDSRQVADVVAAVGSAAAFWSEQSDGAIQVEVTAQHDWMTTTATCADDPFVLWAEVAKAVGWVGGPRRHLLLYLPGSLPPGAPECEYGLGTIGTGVGTGGLAYVTDVSTSVIAHELGHNFSLGHASAKQCDRTVEEGRCALLTYGDRYDVMGYSWEQVGSLNTPHAARLGLLDPTTTDRFGPFSSERVTSLHALDQTGVNGGLELVDPVDGLWSGVSYWLEYRYPRGRDAWLGTTTANRHGLDSGVTLRVAGKQNPSSVLLDASPSPAAAWNGDRQVSLPIGAPVRVASGAFVVTVESADATAARVRVQPRDPIRVAHERAGGSSGSLGGVRGDVHCPPDDGCYQEHERGTVTWWPDTGAHAVRDDVLAAWNARGGRWGPLGRPTADEFCGLRDGGCFQGFERGSVYSTPAFGSQAVDGAVWRRWAELGWEHGLLGYPTRAPVCGLRDGGCSQVFQGGSVHWSAATGAQATWGPILRRWSAYGYEGGQLGYPANHPWCGLRGGGCFQVFQGGSVYWSERTGAHAIWGPIRDRWARAGWERGLHGYPASEPSCGLVRSGCFQRFQRGAVYTTPRTGTHSMGLLAPAIARAWADRGHERGRLGYPVSSEYRRPNGVGQRFQGGTLVWDARTGIVRRL